MLKYLSVLKKTFAVGLLLCSLSTVAQKTAFDPLSASIEENIATPAVQPKHNTAVASAMTPLLKAIRNHGFNAQTVRSGEVIMASIPAAELFVPNQRQLGETAKSSLKLLFPYIRLHNKYKVIVAVHCADTGDDMYREELTADRANAIDELFFNLNGGADTGIIPYGLGDDEPLAPNTSLKNRDKNRRVEIYFVPTQEFIDSAKKRK